MRSNCEETATRLRCIRVFAGVVLTAMVVTPMAWAQAQTAEQKTVDTKQIPQVYETIFLINATQQRELNDIQTDLRNMLPMSKIYGEASQSAISIQGSAEDLERARKMIAELDHPRKAYRLTYTISEMDGSKRIGAEHFSLMVLSGETSILKQGSRAPIVTGSYDTGNSKMQTEVQYVDIGLSIVASLDGEKLHSKVERSSVAEDKAVLGAQDPVIRQTILDGLSNLTPGKAIVLGTLDTPGSTRHAEVEVVSELVT